MKYHGGVTLADLGAEDLGAIEAGMANLRRHLHNIREVYGVPCVVAVNRFPTDTDAEVDQGGRAGRRRRRPGLPGDALRRRRGRGGGPREGRAQAARRAVAVHLLFTYDDDLSLTAKVETIAPGCTAPAQVTWDAKARRRLQRIERDGYGGLPVCVAKTQYSFSTDPTCAGAPSGHELHVREVRLSAGAGFVVMVCGDMMTMPGLPATRRRPDRPRPTTGRSSA